MKLTALLIFICILFSVHSQFSIIEKKGKIGLKFADQLIVKPKFDSINTVDSEIATAYRKSSIYYINSSGKNIKKTPISYGFVFTDGFAIISNKKGRYGAINAVGEDIIRCNYKEIPVQYGRILLVKRGEFSGFLYSPSNGLSFNVDSVETEGDWLLSFEKKSVRHDYVKERLLRKDEQKTYYTDDHYFNIYDFKKGVVILDSVVHYYRDQDFSVHTLKDSSVALLGSESQLITRSDYSEIQINKNTLYCTVLNDSIYTTEIRDLTGKVLRNDLLYIKTLDENRHVFQEESLQFIGNEKGEQISPKMTGFGILLDGWRIVYDRFSYTYMNDSTYETLPLRLPVILKTNISTAGGGQARRSIWRGIRNLKTSAGNIARRYTGGTQRALETRDYAFSVKSNQIAVHQYPINGEYIKVVSNTLDSSHNYSNFIEYNYNLELKYNYMTTSGQLINDKHYEFVDPIHNDRFIAKKDNKYVIVSTNGSELTQEFDLIKKDTLGYYITRLMTYPNSYGLLDSDLNEVLPCKYGYFSFIEDGYYEVDYRHRKKLRYKIPD